MVGVIPRDSEIAQMISLSLARVDVAAVLGLEQPVYGLDVVVVCVESSPVGVRVVLAVRDLDIPAILKLSRAGPSKALMLDLTQI